MWKNIIIEDILTNYEISDNGIIRNKNTFKELKFQKKQNGYFQCCLYINNKKRYFLVHRLVALTFLPSEDLSLTVNHKDGNKENNSIDNLEWVSSKENNLHAWKTDLNSPSVERIVLQYDIKGNFLKEYRSVAQAKRETKICKIRECANGERNSAGGYIWKWKEDFILLDKGKKKKVAQIDDKGNIIKIYDSVSAASRETGASRTGISSVCLGKQNKCFNYFWKFVEEDIVY